MGPIVQEALWTPVSVWTGEERKALDPPEVRTHPELSSLLPDVMTTTQPSRELILYREIVAVSSENRLRHVKTLRGGSDVRSLFLILNLVMCGVSIGL